MSSNITSDTNHVNLLQDDRLDSQEYGDACRSGVVGGGYQYHIRQLSGRGKQGEGPDQKLSRAWKLTSTRTQLQRDSSSSQTDRAVINSSYYRYVDHYYSRRPVVLMHLSFQLVVTKGGLKGRRVFLYEDVSAFRFLDLPAEIRTIIYNFLVETDESIRISSFTGKDKIKRAVQASFHLDDASHREGIEYDAAAETYLGQPPSPVMVAQVNRQISDEVLPLVYGSNTFSFTTLGDLKVFLEDIGSNRRHLRHIGLPNNQPSLPSSAKPALSRLIGAYGLRTLSIHHGYICGKEVKDKLEDFVEDITPFMRNFHKVKSAGGRDSGALDLIQVLSTTGCETMCVKSSRCRCASYCCQKGCKGGAIDRHIKDVSMRVRKMLAEKLGILKGS